LCFNHGWLAGDYQGARDEAQENMRVAVKSWFFYLHQKRLAKAATTV